MVVVKFLNMFAEGWRVISRDCQKVSLIFLILEDPFIAAKGKQCQETSLCLLFTSLGIFLNFSVFIFYAV